MPLPNPDRILPHPDNVGPPGPSGSAYTSEVAAEVQALWNGVVNLLGSVGGTGNAITATCSPPLADDYQDGQVFVLVPAANNTLPVTINIDGRGVVDVVRNNGGVLEEDDLVAGVATLLQYFDADGEMRLLNPAPGQLGAAVALGTRRVFTSSDTWNKPAGLHHVVVHVVGGGGGDNTGNGGTSSFGSHCSATGGGGNKGTAGSGSGGDINMTGQRGFGAFGGDFDFQQGGGAPGPYGGPARIGGGAGNNYGGGACGPSSGSAAGSGGGYATEHIVEASLAASESVTVGAGGNGNNDGAPGIVVVEEYVFI